MMSDVSYSLSARWILPIEGEAVENGRLIVVGGRIERIESPARGPADYALGNAAVLPGFVNAHTHLELGPVESASGSDPEDQIAWLERVIRQRIGTSEPAMLEQVDRGVAGSLAGGTTTLADITTAGRSEAALWRSGLRGTVFSEVIGLKRERALETSAIAYDWLNSPAPEPDPERAGRIRRGLSPHAPYSTAPWLYEQIASSHVPLTTHLAELPPELELLATRSGPLLDFLSRIGAYDPEWRPLCDYPAGYIRKKSLRHSDWIVAHATYLNATDFWQFKPESAPGGQRVAVAYCPRTAARFGHGPHPYREIIAHGGAVCLGTDSLASSPDLSVLDEVRFLARSETGFAPEPRLWLTMATLSGAWALRREQEVGSLIPGKQADFAAVSLAGPSTAETERDPYSAVVFGTGPVIATASSGSFLYGPHLSLS